MEKIKAKLKAPGGQFIELGDAPYRIGAFEGICDYVIYDSDVSPIHATIENRDGRWCVQDMNSAAGVKRNGVKIIQNQPVYLEQQDRIEIGGTELTIIMELDLMKETDLKLLNQIYKNWLMSPDSEMKDYHKSELIRMINEKIAPLEVSIGAADKKKVITDIPIINIDEPVGPEKQIDSKIPIIQDDREKQIDHKIPIIQDDPDIRKKPIEPDIPIAKVETVCVLERINQSRDKIIVDANPFIIGSSQNNVNFCLDERGISRKHARIFKKPSGDYCISDLNSKNGTYVNGRRLLQDEVVVMRNDDMVSFAEYNFIITEKEAPAGSKSVQRKTGHLAYQTNSPVFEDELFEEEGTAVVYGANHTPPNDGYDPYEPETETVVMGEDDEYDSATMVLDEDDQYDEPSDHTVNQNTYTPSYTYNHNSQPEPYDAANGETMPLGGYDDDDDATSVISDARLICILERVDHNREKVIVDTDPFIIGKSRNEVNFCLDEKGISRQQSKIAKTPEGNFCIQDLNSKNGTYINGRKLKKDEAVTMRNGDMISFAEYNFIISIGQNYE